MLVLELPPLPLWGVEAPFLDGLQIAAAVLSAKLALVETELQTFSLLSLSSSFEHNCATQALFFSSLSAPPYSWSGRRVGREDRFNSVKDRSSGK